MKKFYIVFLTVFSVAFSHAQSKMNNSLKTRLEERALPAQFTILAQGNLIRLQQSTVQGYTLNYCAGNIASVTLDINSLTELLQQKIITYAEFIEPNKKTMNDTMLVKNRIKPVKQGAAPLPQAYNGSGIVVGIIDTGIDFNHPDFKDASGNTRIAFLWDQVPSSGSTVPMPFNYGIEWTAAQINASVCTHNDLPHYGHGTHVSGVAAGNAMANGTHMGCASQSTLVVVALDFNKAGPTIADAVQYIYSKATAMGKPCVINASVGDYYGSHDGTDLEAQMIKSMVQNVPGRVMVGAAGNAGGIKFHVKTQPPANDTSFTWLQPGGNNTVYYWCYADTPQIQNMQISVGANRANFSDLGRIGFKNYNYGLQSTQTDTLKNNGNRIGIVKTSASINSFGIYELFVRVFPDSANLLWRVESKGNGLHHAWNFDFVSSGLPAASQYPLITKYKMPDTLYSIVSSFQCLDDVITVANYNNLSYYYDVNNTLQPSGGIGGARAASSSIGPTRDGKQKPDISATGDYVFSAIPLSMLPNLIANAPTAVAQGSYHVMGGGTSAASPVVAGLAALYLEYFPQATSMMVKNAVNACAYSDSFTGNTLPDYYWGNGKLDGKAALLCFVSDVAKNSSTGYGINFYPNPFSDKITIGFSKEVTGTLFIYSTDGKLLFEDKVIGYNYEINSCRFSYDYKGLLLARIVTANEVINTKIIRTN